MKHPPGTPPAAYLVPYRQALNSHGSGFGVTLWASHASQRTRFEVMVQELYLPGKRILDAGCSRGDFARFMLDRDIAYGRYIGVDALDDIITHARDRQLPRAEFHVGDLVHDARLWTLGKPQVITISGTLNTMDDAAVMTILASAWEAAGETLAFNFLSDCCGPRAIPQFAPARRLDTLALLGWATRQTWDVRFRQDYFEHGHDATIIMTRP
ncbi:MAG: methyltransferase domain-containing protein [Phycisphaeraceae bacterium]